MPRLRARLGLGVLKREVHEITSPCRCITRCHGNHAGRLPSSAHDTAACDAMCVKATATAAAAALWLYQLHATARAGQPGPARLWTSGIVDGLARL